MATKKKAARPAKKSAARKSGAKKTVSRKSTTKKSGAKKPAKKSAAKKTAIKKTSSKKRPIKKALPKPPKGVDVTKIVIPPVPARGATSSTTSTPVAAKPGVAASAPAKKNSSGVLFLVIAGVVLLAIFALSNSSSDDDAAPKPTASESVSEEPSEEPTEETTEEPSDLTYEAPSSFVAINNASGGVTLRWKAPAASEGLTGYLVSISYNAVDFTEVATVPANQLNLDVAKMGDEGGTQFFIQSVYSDGTKADGAKFALKGKYGN
ncbi:MAG: hypothetical protein FGM63_05805 [Candidatus Nanopelagicaceae bacterium]|nr:hypothetical protein [Candidatus Nanopelagicaceae bacterium]